MAIILGIDPGSRTTGYGIVREEKKSIYYVDSGCIKTSSLSFSQRLLEIYDGICELMDSFSPDEVAIEQVFVHHNVSAALKLGQARGAALVAAASHRIVISEYSPREIKQALVGTGAAEKTQVQHMVVSILKLNRTPQSDAADALAIAICHCYRRTKLGGLIHDRLVTR